MTTSVMAAPAASSLQSFLAAHPVATSQYNDETSRTIAAAHHTLALQIAHNLHYQHRWTDVRIHTTSSLSSLPLPRPLLTGVPPTRLYLHPDEQIALLQAQKAAGKAGLPTLNPEREWVLPSHLREKWSLRRFGEVFDRIERAPNADEGERLFEDEDDAGEDDTEEQKDEVEVESWRTKSPKRALLATLDDDSTVVYYIVHDGIVKPRQN